jgi:acyl-CoA oxidase
MEKNPLDAFRVDPHVLRSRTFHLAALRFRERQLLVRAVARIRKRLGAKMPPDEARLEVQEHLITLAEAYAHRLALTFFDEAVTKVADDGLRAELDRLGALHAIELLRRDAAFYMQEGYFDSDRASELRKESERLRAELVPRAVGLVDAFAIPATCLAAPIAFMDPANPVW